MIINYVNKSFFNKIPLLLFFLIIFKIPIINNIDYALFIIFIILILNIREFKTKFNYKIIILLIFSIFISYLFENKSIIENHSIFLPNKINQELYLKSNNQSNKLLIDDFYNSYNENDLECKNYKKKCWLNVKIDQKYSRSFDNIYFGKFAYSRKVDDIDHSNISSARIGDINTLKFNWFSNPDKWWDKKSSNKIKRINAPYIILYKFIDEKYSESHICWKGKAIIDNATFITNNKKNKCLKITKNLKILFFNFDNELKVKLKKSISIILLDLFLVFLKLFCLTILVFIFIKRINIKNFLIHLGLSILSSIILIYTIFSKKEFSFGYNPYQGGMDGLVHEGYGRVMYENFLNMNLLNTLKGVESIYYFMPGLRYFSFLEKLFFGDNHFGIYTILIFLPIIFFIFFEKFNFTKKFTIFLIVLFIIIKIPHLGFSYQHYIKSFLTFYPETLAIFSFFISLILLSKRKFFSSGLACAIMVFLRPNYLPAFVIVNFFNIISSLNEADNKRFFLFLFGSSFIFVMPIHNYFFGNSFIFFVKAHGVSRLNINPYEYLYMFQNENYLQKIILHLKNLLTNGQRKTIVYFINSLFLMNLVIFYFFNFKKIYNYTNFLCLLSIAQLTPLFFYDNTDRYGYFSWLLITFTNIFIINEYLKKYNIKKVYI